MEVQVLYPIHLRKGHDLYGELVVIDQGKYQLDEIGNRLVLKGTDIGLERRYWEGMAKRSIPAMVVFMAPRKRRPVDLESLGIAA